jgi:hypothetical protein
MNRLIPLWKEICIGKNETIKRFFEDVKELQRMRYASYRSRDRVLVLVQCLMSTTAAPPRPISARFPFGAGNLIKKAPTFSAGLRQQPVDPARQAPLCFDTSFYLLFAALFTPFQIRTSD